MIIFWKLWCWIRGYHTWSDWYDGWDYDKERNCLNCQKVDHIGEKNGEYKRRKAIIDEIEGKKGKI